jgi:subfamily B ATP-binding cassette protein MsbA
LASALDKESEVNFQAALLEIVLDWFLIIIAHRLLSIQGVDRIIVINQGELYERGKLSELLERQAAVITLGIKWISFVFQNINWLNYYISGTALCI